MLILKIYLTITWLIGIGVGIYARNNWTEINYDNRFDMFNPNYVIPIIILLFPIILPIALISEICKTHDN